MDSTSRNSETFEPDSPESLGLDQFAVPSDDGLSLDELSQATGGRPFRECTPDQQRHVVEQLAAREEHPESLGDRFFVKAKRATINGYYTSQIGIHRRISA